MTGINGEGYGQPLSYIGIIETGGVDGVDVADDVDSPMAHQVRSASCEWTPSLFMSQ